MIDSIVLNFEVFLKSGHGGTCLLLVLGGQRQKDLELKVSHGYVMKPYQRNKKGA